MNPIPGCKDTGGRAKLLGTRGVLFEKRWIPTKGDFLNLQISTKIIEFWIFFVVFQATNGLRQFPELDGPSNRRIVGSQVQLFRANFYTSPWR